MFGNFLAVGKYLKGELGSMILFLLSGFNTCAQFFVADRTRSSAHPTRQRQSPDPTWAYSSNPASNIAGVSSELTEVGINLPNAWTASYGRRSSV